MHLSITLTSTLLINIILKTLSNIVFTCKSFCFIISNLSSDELFDIENISFLIVRISSFQFILTSIQQTPKFLRAQSKLKIIIY